MSTRKPDEPASESPKKPGAADHGVDFDAMINDIDLDALDEDALDEALDEALDIPEEIVRLAALRLPDATPPGGDVATEAAIKALCDEIDPDSDELSELLDGAAAFDLGELVGPNGRLTLRVVAFVDHEEDDSLLAYLAMRNENEVDVLATTFVSELDPELSESGDRMRLASLVLDGLSQLDHEGLRLSLAPAFGFLARPYEPVQVGSNLRPEDRQAARSARIKARKRGR